MQTATGRTAALAAALLALGCAACESSKAPPKKADDVFTAWRNAGLDVGLHDELSEHGLGDGSCQRGEVEDIETTLCSYADEDGAREAQPAGLELVGEATGASLNRGHVLLIVADREGEDPNGKTIHRITKAFLGR